MVNDLKAGQKKEALKDLTSLLPSGEVQAAIADLLAGNAVGAVFIVVTDLHLPSGLLTDIVPDILSGNLLEAVGDLVGLLPAGAVEVAIADILAHNIPGAEAALLSLCP